MYQQQNSNNDVGSNRNKQSNKSRTPEAQSLFDRLKNKVGGAATDILDGLQTGLSYKLPNVDFQINDKNIDNIINSIESGPDIQIKQPDIRIKQNDMQMKNPDIQMRDPNIQVQDQNVDLQVDYPTPLVDDAELQTYFGVGGNTDIKSKMKKKMSARNKLKSETPISRVPQRSINASRNEMQMPIRNIRPEYLQSNAGNRDWVQLVREKYLSEPNTKS
jgi:hypothetical protein